MRLENKIAIVTGAGGGIGRAISVQFAANGASVVCVDIDAKILEETVAVVNQNDGTAIGFAGDVADEQTAIDAVALAKAEYGGLHVLVSAAVCDIANGPVTEIEAVDWRRTMDVNLTAAFLLSKHAIPEMAKAGGGSIILIASQLGQVARPGRAWYCAQKAGLINMARAMALDHASQNIRVNSLSPGPIETDRYVRNFDSLEDARASNSTLFDRLGRPDEIAAGAVFLASDETSFMTGSDLLMDGGYTAV